MEAAAEAFTICFFNCQCLSLRAVDLLSACGG